MIALLLNLLVDPFRVGLLIALFATMQRTRGATGIWLPLALGIVFVAVLIPTTMQTVLPAPLWQVIALGVLANGILMAGVMAAWALFQRSRR